MTYSPQDHTVLGAGMAVPETTYSSTGHYDHDGNYHPGYTDADGQYFEGYAWFDEVAGWQVAHGYWDADGAWVATGEVADFPEPEALRRFFDDLRGDELEVAFMWHHQVLSVDRYTGGVSVGQDEGHDFMLDDVSGPDGGVWRLVTDGATPSVRAHESMHVTVRRRDEIWSLSDCIESGLATPMGQGWYRIDLTDRTLGVRIDVGDYAFLVRYSEALAGAGPRVGFDRDPLPYVGISAAAHILLLLIIMTLPENAGAMELEAHLAHDRFVQLAIEPEQEEPDDPKWLDDAVGEQASAKHAGAEGDAGKPDETRDDRRLAIKGDRAPEDITMKKARDLQIASTAGIASLGIASMYGDAALTVGSDAESALGNLDGEVAGASKGMFGFGVRCESKNGGCFGGGGDLSGSLGLARIATKGRATGDRDYGKGVADPGERDAKTPGRVIFDSKPRLTGGLDSEIIRRVVRSHRREIKFCYETELQKNPNLQGEVTAKFTIMPNGRVISSVTDSSSLKNRAVERCMHNKIKRWIFPEPDGGGTVIVRYPFRFTRA